MSEIGHRTAWLRNSWPIFSAKQSDVNPHWWSTLFRHQDSETRHKINSRILPNRQCSHSSMFYHWVTHLSHSPRKVYFSAECISHRSFRNLLIMSTDFLYAVSIVNYTGYDAPRVTQDLHDFVLQIFTQIFRKGLRVQKNLETFAALVALPAMRMNMIILRL